ncbi:MAG: beta-hydroxyacyl-ACP dehydratase [Paludibacterium sp.]|uniref:beta-hydroxyacyl-ACP dehydratase n=1 Tax=Paludibacterium sp. TaxID=1917523 RepID=UPI0025D33D3C|nr:beta-hydroxyacyl-ACP dehydratase [Paludibacterium sp.]MBV8045742.1 beta-hydroxyacyl-ACP dehydratase [Paludibacterium sp.]MBV8649753.1 beta-hydroxyacyl-ACP dehydratase [Paludibacterium sp.]
MITVTLAIPADHPAFAGHFPGRPIVPGVVLLDLAYQAIVEATRIAPIGLSVAKFHCPAGPGAALQLDIEPSGDVVRFVIREGARKVADGKFLLPESAV